MVPESASPSTNTWRYVGFAVGLTACAMLMLAPTGLHSIAGHGSRPAYAAGVTALMVCLWLTEALPIALTACIPLVLYPAFGVFGKGFSGDVGAVTASFFEAYLFLFLGGMAIGAAMEQWNLHRRVALNVMRVIGTNPSRLLLGVLVATTGVSLWLSNTATAVMMFPIALALVKEMEKKSGKARLSLFGTAVMLSVAYGSNVGGIGTKIGTAPNSIFSGFISEKMHVEIGFLRYIAIAFPFVLIFVPIVWGVLWLVARKEPLEGVTGRDVIVRELEAMGPISGGERKVAVVFLTAATLWISAGLVIPEIAPHASRLLGFRFQSKHYEATVSMLAAFALLASGALTLRNLAKIPWDTLVLLGGSFAMAAGIEQSGLSIWLGERFAGLSGMPLLAQIAIATTGTIALSAVASNTATINVALNMLPPNLSVLFATTMAASCDFMLPAGTPPNAIVFGSGYIRLSTMIRVGFLLDLAAALVVTLHMYLYGQWVLP